MSSTIYRHFATLLLVIVVCFSTASLVSAHGDVDHETTSHAENVTEAQLQKMHALVDALQQLIVLLNRKIELESGDASHAHDTNESDENTLQVWVEIHSNITHVHIVQHGEEDSFVLEDLSYTQEEEIIDAIAHETGLLAHDIEAVIEFPSGEVDAHGDSIEDHDTEEHDVSGIHIMSDGAIMWGNGERVEGATLTVDGKVKLSDGRIIVPAFDLR